MGNFTGDLDILGGLYIRVGVVNYFIMLLSVVVYFYGQRSGGRSSLLVKDISIYCVACVAKLSSTSLS